MHGVKTDNTLDITFLEDAAGERILDVACKVSCGACCSYWLTVEELHHHVVGATITPTRCPHLRRRGCHLKRSKMPAICKAYLCQLGMLAHEGLVTEEEIKHVVALKAQNYAARELKKVLLGEKNENTTRE